MKPTRLTLVLIVSSFLFFFNTNTRMTYSPKKISPLIRLHLELMKKLQEKENFSLTRAFVIGDKRSLTKKQKENFKILNINHLFTPSGIHFSSFFILFLPLIKRLRKRGNKKTSFIIELALCLLPFGLNQFYSLKRISLLRITGLFSRPFKIKIDYFYLFIGSFVFDFFFGTFKHNPLSFSFSFLFLGTLLSCTKTSSLLVSFFVANIFVSFFFYQDVNILGFAFGFFITTVFSFLFPFIFLLYWPSSFIGIDLSSPFIYIIKLLVETSSNISKLFPSVEIGLIGLIFVFIFSCNRRMVFLSLALLFSSCRIYNVPHNRIRSKTYDSDEVLKNGQIQKQKQIFETKERICRRRIILNGHQVRCKKK